MVLSKLGMRCFGNEFPKTLSCVSSGFEAHLEIWKTIFFAKILAPKDLRLISIKIDEVSGINGIAIAPKFKMEVRPCRKFSCVS